MPDPGTNPATSKGWMKGPTGSLRAALLGLALERPGHGYDLANRLADRLGETWPFASKDIYRLLGQLEREELLVLREERKTGRKGTLSVYHPTELAAPALTEWIETLAPKEPMREGIRAKVAVAREQDSRALLSALKEYERLCLQLLRLVPPATEVRAWSGLVVDCSREAVGAQLRGEVEWSRRTRQRIGEYLAQRSA